MYAPYLYPPVVLVVMPYHESVCEKQTQIQEEVFFEMVCHHSEDQFYIPLDGFSSRDFEFVKGEFCFRTVQFERENRNKGPP